MERELEIDDIGFSNRTHNFFIDQKIISLNQLLNLSAGNLRRENGCTHSVLNDIRRKLAFHNLALFGDVLVINSSSLILSRDIPKMLESICQSVRDLNYVIRETQNRISDLEEQICKIIAAEQYKN